MTVSSPERKLGAFLWSKPCSLPLGLTRKEAIHASKTCFEAFDRSIEHPVVAAPHLGHSAHTDALHELVPPAQRSHPTSQPLTWTVDTLTPPATNWEVRHSDPRSAKCARSFMRRKTR